VHHTVRTDEHVGLGGSKDNGLDAMIIHDIILPQSLGFISKLERDCIDRLGAVKANNGHARPSDFYIVKEFVLAVC